MHVLDDLGSLENGKIANFLNLFWKSFEEGEIYITGYKGMNTLSNKKTVTMLVVPT